MKKNISFYFVFAVLIAFSACKKYEDGPFLTLRTPEQRIDGNWESESIEGSYLDYFNDLLSNIGDSVLVVRNLSDLELEAEFEKDGDCELEIRGRAEIEMMNGNVMRIPFSESMDGNWRFKDDKEVIEIDIDDEEIIWEIIKLTNKELIVDWEEINTTIEFGKD